MDTACSRRLFFTIFNVSRRGEKGSNKNCWEHLSLKGHSKYKLFKSYSDSLKPWKAAYFWVSPVNSNAVEKVATVNNKGDFTGAKFPIGWSKFHYNRTTTTYFCKEERLNANDKETLRLFQNMVTHLPTSPRLINVRPIVKARSHMVLRAALGRF